MSDELAAETAEHRDRGHTVLYRFFDTSDVLLYVGISCRLSSRWRAHGREKDWWLEAVRATMEHFDTWDAARVAERRAIKVEAPKYNVVHAPRRESAPRLAPPIGDSAKDRPEWITVSQAAEILGMSRVSVNRSLADEKVRREWWGEQGVGWRRRPLSRRLMYHVSKQRALELLRASRVRAVELAGGEEKPEGG
jgi:hypothetical protein